MERLGDFFAHESCGKCYPCQMGTQRQKEVLHRLAEGRLLEGDRERLENVGWTMTEASLCGLGQTAAGAVLSAIRLWPAMFSQDDRRAVEGEVLDRGRAGSNLATDIEVKSAKALKKRVAPRKSGGNQAKGKKKS
jgi:hypothetical protein